MQSRSMFSRHSTRFYARIFIALVFMQVAMAAYACPLIAKTINAAGAGVAADPAHEHAAAMGGCAQPGSGDAENTSLCHQHYAGDQSFGQGTSVFAAASTTASEAMVPASLKPIAVQRSIVLPILLQRTTAPPLSIRFQVLRI